MWIVQLAVRRPYTFIVTALSRLIVSLLLHQNDRDSKAAG
jgi:hypothetical protein